MQSAMGQTGVWSGLLGELAGGALFSGLMTAGILGFLVERAAALVTESNLYRRVRGRAASPAADDRAIVLLFSVGVCFYLQFDLPAIVLGWERANALGLIITAVIVGSGGELSVRLIRRRLRIGAAT